MNGLLTSLRFPFALRGAWAAAALGRATAAQVGVLDPEAPASDRFDPRTFPESAPRADGTLEAPPIARHDAAVAAIPDAIAPTLPTVLPPTIPVEPSVPVAAAHLVDPVGLRVVPFRPATRWPLRRAAPRIYDPFRGFPMRSAHLAGLMDGRPARR